MSTQDKVYKNNSVTNMASFSGRLVKPEIKDYETRVTHESGIGQTATKLLFVKYNKYVSYDFIHNTFPRTKDEILKV